MRRSAVDLARRRAAALLQAERTLPQASQQANQQAWHAQPLSVAQWQQQRGLQLLNASRAPAPHVHVSRHGVMRISHAICIS